MGLGSRGCVHLLCCCGRFLGEAGLVTYRGEAIMPGASGEVSTGVAELDKLIHGLWVGDNVVFQIGRIEDYQAFVTPFYQWSTKAGRRTIYLRFASHPPLVPLDDPAIEVHELDPGVGFEMFLTRIHGVIRDGGLGACYIFDCLSELAADWFSDDMLGNFFRLTCPYLYDMETIAYFGLTRHRHSVYATTPIRETTQLFLDIYSLRKTLFVRPVKIQMRHSHSLFQLQEWRDGTFEPVTDSCTIAKILNATSRSRLETAIGRMDIWHRTFLYAEQVMQDEHLDGHRPARDHETFRHLLRMLVSRDERILRLAGWYFSMDDVLAIAKRTIGTGLIGGKAVGMLLARAILARTSTRWQDLLEVHDSFFIGSDVFFSFLVRNGCWWIRQQQMDDSALLQGAQMVRRRIITGTFHPDTEAQFAEMLDYFGKSPIIVRSSSLLEDAFGNSFAGKYESVFCANQGSSHQRLEDFIAAIKTVYASSTSEDALAYRMRHGLMDQDEQMGLLVQRVSGSQHGSMFYPHVGGVGFSHNLFAWSDEIDPNAGILRLVFGLGTRAVDRMDDDYTRLVALNAPLRLPEASDDGMPTHTQRLVDVIDLHTNQVATHAFDEVSKVCPDVPFHLFASRDARAAREARQSGRGTDSVPFRLGFKALLGNTPFAEDMREMLRILEEAYECPVDVEYTANFQDDNQYQINVVQCRPLQVTTGTRIEGEPKQVPHTHKLLETAGPVIGRGREERVDNIIYVVPRAYAALPLRLKYSVARLIGSLVHHPKVREKGNIMLLGPGRWGTTTPTLGVTVKFPEIEHATYLCEIVEMGDHPVPEISLGTHFFSEMVEMDMLYLVLVPEDERSLLNRAWLEEADNQLLTLAEDAAELEEAVRVIDATRLADGNAVMVRADTVAQEVLCYLDHYAPDDSD